MKFKTQFDYRWNEPLGLPEAPYMHRYMLMLFGFSIRLHIWHRSDDKRYMHDHAIDFLTIVLKGSYTDVSYDPVIAEIMPEYNETRDPMCRWAVRYRKAEHLHYVGNPEDPTVTLLFCGRKRRNWGFLVKNDKHPNGKWMRPLRFFSRYGHPGKEEK